MRSSLRQFRRDLGNTSGERNDQTGSNRLVCFDCATHKTARQQASKSKNLVRAFVGSTDCPKACRVILTRRSDYDCVRTNGPAPPLRRLARTDVASSKATNERSSQGRWGYAAELGRRASLRAKLKSGPLPLTLAQSIVRCWDFEPMQGMTAPFSAQFAGNSLADAENSCYILRKRCGK